MDLLDLLGILMLLIPVAGLGLSLELLKIEALILGFLAYGQLRSPLRPSPRPRLALALIGLSLALALAAGLSGQARSLFDVLSPNLRSYGFNPSVAICNAIAETGE